jgi:hypothetical protein
MMREVALLEYFGKKNLLWLILKMNMICIDKSLVEYFIYSACKFIIGKSVVMKER